MYGLTRYYSFSLPAHQDVTYAALNISRGGSPAASFPLQNDIFVVPSMTATEGSTVVDFAVAVRTTTIAAGQPSSTAPAPDITISAPVKQQGTLAPRIARQKAGAQPGTAVVPGYQLWKGSVDLASPATGAVSVSAAAGVLQGGGAVRDVLYISAGVAGW